MKSTLIPMVRDGAIISPLKLIASYRYLDGLPRNKDDASSIVVYGVNKSGYTPIAECKLVASNIQTTGTPIATITTAIKNAEYTHAYWVLDRKSNPIKIIGQIQLIAEAREFPDITDSSNTVEAING